MSAESDSLQASHNETANSPGELVADAAAIALPEEPPSVGQLLRAAREAKGMTLTHVAERLKLSPHQVEALENDDWSRLQCNTITRGFIRNYARLVALDASGLMSALDRIARPEAKELAVPESINVKVPSEHGVARRDYVRVGGGLAALVLAVLAYFFLPPEFLQSTYSALKDRLGSKPSVVAAKEAEPEGRAVETTTVQPAEPSARPESPAEKVSTVQAEPATAPVTETKTAVASTGDNVLRFDFSKAAWVEVKDRSGQILFSQLSPAGSQREVSGQPPFSLIVGNAGNVTLQYKGKGVDLSKRSKDDVARLTLE